MSGAAKKRWEPFRANPPAPSFNLAWTIEESSENLLERAETAMRERRFVEVDPEQWLVDLEYVRRRRIAEGKQ